MENQGLHCLLKRKTVFRDINITGYPSIFIMEHENFIASKLVVNTVGLKKDINDLTFVLMYYCIY